MTDNAPHGPARALLENMFEDARAQPPVTDIPRKVPRTGDRVVLLSPRGDPLTTWRITACRPVPGARREAFTLTVAVRAGELDAVTYTA